MYASAQNGVEIIDDCYFNSMLKFLKGFCFVIVEIENSTVKYSTVLGLQNTKLSLIYLALFNNHVICSMNSNV